MQGLLERMDAGAWVPRLLQVGLVLSVAAFFAFVPGCPSAGGGGDGARCAEEGAACTADEDCCEGLVCGADGLCEEAPAVCAAEGEACTANADCCTGLECVDDVCTVVEVVCAEEGEACTADADCCTGLECVDDVCAVVEVVCAEEGEACTADADCCTGLECVDDVCAEVVGCAGDADCPDDGLYCTGVESCDTATGDCVASGDPCTGNTVCNDDTDTCDPVPCTSDAECPDDGVYCNGAESCDTVAGECVSSGDPCAPDDCDEDNDQCVVVGEDDLEAGNPGVTFGNLTAGTGVELTAPVATTPRQVTIADCVCTWSVDGAGTFDPPACTTTYMPAADDTLVSVNVVCTDATTGDEFEDSFYQTVAVAVGGCLTDAECDDGLFCNGDETCGTDGLCAAGTSPCATDEVCDEDQDVCLGVCPGGLDSECDDGLYCNGAETCGTDGLCDAGTDPCAVGELCDETSDTCVGCLTNADCPDATPICTSAFVCVECETNDDCGADESCIDNVCAAIKEFTLNQDNLFGTTGDDTFSAPLITNQNGEQVPSLQTGDKADGKAGTDTLNASFKTSAAGGDTVAPTLSLIEVFNLSDFGSTQTTAQLGNCTGVTNVNADSSTRLTAVTDIGTVVDLGITNTDNGLSATFKQAATAGTADNTTLTLSGVLAGDATIFTNAASGFETIGVESTGSAANVLDNLFTYNTGTSTYAAGLKTMTVTGTQSVKLKTVPTTLVTSISGSGMTSGGLTLGTGTSVTGTSPYTSFGTFDVGSVVGGPGDDMFIFAGTLDSNDADGTTEYIDGGDGTGDVFQASLGASITTAAAIKNIEELRLNATGNYTFSLTNVAGIDTLTVEADGTSNTLTLSNLAGTPALAYRGNGAEGSQVFDAVTYALMDATGSQTLNVTVGNRGVALGPSGSSNAYTLGLLTAADIETFTLTISDMPTSASSPTTLGGITGSGMTSLTVTCPGDLVTGTIAGKDNALSTVNLVNVSGRIKTTSTITELNTGATVTLTANNDTVTVTPGTAKTGVTVNCGAGDDTIAHVEDGASTVNVNGEAGDDTMTTNATTGDTFNGGNGNDTLTGAAGADIISGGSGNDVIVGGAGANTLNGGDGNDTITGGAGVDTITCGSGTNTVTGGAGADLITGGTGADSFVVATGDTGITLATADTISAFTTADDVITTSLAAGDCTIADGSGLADFAAFVVAADAVLTAGAGTDDAYMAYDAAATGNGWLVIDEDDGGAVNAGDTLIILTGVNLVTEFVVADIG